MGKFIEIRTLKPIGSFRDEWETSLNAKYEIEAFNSF